jgi:thiol:disulfide interchange protein
MPLSENFNVKTPLGKWPYILGLASLIPFLGVLPALAALVWGFLRADDGGWKVMLLALLGLGVTGGLAVTYSGTLFPQPAPVSLAAAPTGEAGPIAWLQPADGLKESQRTQKPILYDFTAAWCHFCKIEKATVFEKAEDAAKINGAFVPVVVMDRIQEDKKNPADVAELQAKYKIRGFPTLVIQYPGSADFKQLVGFRNEKYVMDFIAQSKP